MADRGMAGSGCRTEIQGTTLGRRSDAQELRPDDQPLHRHGQARPWLRQHERHHRRRLLRNIVEPGRSERLVCRGWDDFFGWASYTTPTGVGACGYGVLPPKTPPPFFSGAATLIGVHPDTGGTGGGSGGSPTTGIDGAEAAVGGSSGTGKGGSGGGDTLVAGTGGALDAGEEREARMHLPPCPD